MGNQTLLIAHSVQHVNHMVSHLISNIWSWYLTVYTTCTTIYFSSEITSLRQLHRFVTIPHCHLLVTSVYRQKFKKSCLSHTHIYYYAVR